MRTRRDDDGICGKTATTFAEDDDDYDDQNVFRSILSFSFRSIHSIQQRRWLVSFNSSVRLPVHDWRDAPTTRPLLRTLRTSVVLPAFQLQLCQGPAVALGSHSQPASQLVASAPQNTRVSRRAVASAGGRAAVAAAPSGERSRTCGHPDRAHSQQLGGRVALLAAAVQPARPAPLLPPLPPPEPMRAVILRNCGDGDDGGRATHSPHLTAHTTS